MQPRHDYRHAGMAPVAPEVDVHVLPATQMVKGAVDLQAGLSVNLSSRTSSLRAAYAPTTFLAMEGGVQYAGDHKGTDVAVWLQAPIPGRLGLGVRGSAGVGYSHDNGAVLRMVLPTSAEVTFFGAPIADDPGGYTTVSAIGQVSYAISKRSIVSVDGGLQTSHWMQQDAGRQFMPMAAVRLDVPVSDRALLYAAAGFPTGLGGGVTLRW